MLEAGGVYFTYIDVFYQIEICLPYRFRAVMKLLIYIKLILLNLR